MNQRIKELLEQAGVKYVTMPNDTVYEKFAELIVRECMSNLYLNGYDDAMMQIKKHFGVEL